jgi:hypothetical protein
MTALRPVRVLVVVAAFLLFACSSSGGGGDVSDVVPSDGAVDVAVDGDALPDVPNDHADLDVPADEQAGGNDPGTGGEADGALLPMKKIRFAAPTEGATATGTVRVEIEAVDGSEWLVDEVVVALNGSPIFTDTKLPTGFLLDTREHPAGPAFLEAAARIQEQYETAVTDLSIANASYRFVRVFPDHPTYANGKPVQIEVDLGAPGIKLTPDFSLFDSAFDADLVSINDRGDGTYLVAYTVNGSNTRPDGEYPVPLTASHGGFDETYRGARVRLQNQLDSPLRVLGALQVDEVPPAVSTDAARAPSVLKIAGNDQIIAGGTASLKVTASDPQGAHEVVGLLFEITGRKQDGHSLPYHGFYQVPLEFFAGDAEVTLHFDTAGRAESEYKTLQRLELAVSALDPLGLRSVPLEYAFTVNHQAASGDVQVSVSWDTASDVDLHVVEPKADGNPGGANEEIFYSDKEGPQGGTLDLDSNAGCGIDGVNNENVTWDEVEPPAGTYRVYVDYWSACDVWGPESTHWIVTVKNCGTAEMFEGSFSSEQSNGGSKCLQDNTDCQLVTEFDSDCGGYVYGDVRFEDRTFDEQGFRARSWRPVRHARVEVRRQNDNAVLATGTTDGLGHYAINFGNNGAAGVYVRIFTQTDLDEGLRKVAIRNHPKFGIVYSFAAPAFDETLAETHHLNIDIPETDATGLGIAGAFNIFDVLVSGHDLIRRMTGRSLKALDAYWQTGADTTETSYCSKKRYDDGLCSNLGTLSIQGRDDDRDEFDDCVILQELFRFAEDQLSISDDPGGAHDGSRDDPLRAWGNGVSMFFASNTLGVPYFVNKGRYGVTRFFDLEAMPSPFAFRTSDGTMTGRVSEYLVAAALWDLADAPSEPVDDDGVQGKALGIYDSVFHYLNKQNLGGGERGVAGRDLVDFLDGWLCRGHASADALKAILDGRQFPYDLAAPSSCL